MSACVRLIPAYNNPRPARHPLTILAAIDVGSNALRMGIGEVLANGRIDVFETARDPVRLGQDVFSEGRLSPEIIDRTVAAFHTFCESIRRTGSNRPPLSRPAR